MLKAIKSGNGWVGIFIGFLIAGIFYFFSLSSKEPVYSKKSVNYISDFSSTLSDLSVFYKGQKVKNLTRTKLIFVNFGKSTIYQKDIAPKDRPRIVSDIPGINILSVKKIYEKRPVSSINLLRNPKNFNEYFIDFDFLDRDDGFIVQIIHNGISDEAIKVTGTIIGSEEIKNSSFSKRRISFFGDINDTIVQVLVIIYFSICLIAYYARRNSILKIIKKLSIGKENLSEEQKLRESKVFEEESKHELKSRSRDLKYSIFFMVFTFFLYFPFTKNLIVSVFSKLLPIGYELFFN